ncbi:MAG: hypothetical protein RIR49_764 [Actinomycetota bacterium]|jgi:hypothetical protein
MTGPAVDSVRTATERWFRHQGLPTFIADYSVTRDVLTRVAPFMGIVVFVELFQVFGDRWKGPAQAAAFAAGLVAMVGIVVLTNLLRRRPPLSLPIEVAWPEIALYLAVPVVPAIIGADGEPAVAATATIVVNLLLLGVAYITVRWGLVSMLRWSVRQMVRQVLGVSRLALKSLPLILLFSAFVFLNAEMWQVANDLTAVALGGITVMIVGIGAAFVAGAVRRMSDDLSGFTHWGEVGDLCVGTPMEGHARAETPTLAASTVDLSRREHTNTTVRLFVALSTQILLVAVVTTVFYVIFGILTVRETTLLQWTTVGELDDGRDWLVRIPIAGSEYLFSRQLLVVSTVIGLVSGLQFTVQVITDREFRDEFIAETTTDLRRAMAVRAAYLSRVTD